MSQFLCSSINSKSYLMSSSNTDSSHPSFWPQRRSSSEAIAWSYPPKSNLCAKVFAGISAKLANFSHNYNTFNTQLFHNNSQIDELLSTQVMRRMGSFSESDCVSPSSADRTALSDEERQRLISVTNNCCDSSVDSDSSNGEKNQKIQQICDSKVVQSMQNDRQKKKKRKRRRRKKKSLSKSSTPCSSVPCFSMAFSRNDFISIIFDNDCSYDSNDDDISSDEELTCFVERIAPDLEKMCKNLFFDCFSENDRNVRKTNNSGIDEIDCCQKLSSVEPHLAEEEEEGMTSIEELIKKANEKWSNSYSNVSSDDRISAKVNFTSEKPSVRTLHVWDYASRQARCGHWGQLAIDRQRFAERCRRINAEIGHIFGKEHRLRVYRERVLLNA